MKITLKQLRIFSAVARHESISLAAEEVSLTQSAASMALKELESQLDTQLFYRNGKRLKLNHIGESLQPKVQQLLQLAAEIEQIGSEGKLTGHICIGASTTIGNYLAPAIIAEFLEQYPQAHIDLKVANTEQIINDMLHLRIDIGMIEGLCDTPQLVKEAWRQDDLKIFCASHHPLAKKQKVTIDDIANTAWILREKGSGTRDIFTNATHEKFQPKKQLLELGNSEAIKQAVKTGFGISCLSEIAIHSELLHKELHELKVDDLDLHRQLFIIKHKSQYTGKLLAAVEDKLWKHSNIS